MAFQRRKRGPRTIRPTSYRRSERRTRPRASAESSHGWTSREGKEARGQSALRLTDVLRGGGGLGEASCFSGVDPWIQLRCCALVILREEKRGEKGRLNTKLHSIDRMPPMWLIELPEQKNMYNVPWCVV
ncbi:uncharacterized protein [Cardiocondyla obscurior]|uniref:uncharacterized protein n=1 Tax=Cardiocondyla obscurior TaxID=286306 RepID=UPI003965853C